MESDNVISRIVPYLQQSANSLDRGTVERLAAIRREAIGRHANGIKPGAAVMGQMNSRVLRGGPTVRRRAGVRVQPVPDTEGHEHRASRQVCDSTGRYEHRG